MFLKNSNQHAIMIMVDELNNLSNSGGNKTFIDIIKLGSACGTANVLEAESGFVSKDNVEKIFNLVKVKQIL